MATNPQTTKGVKQQGEILVPGASHMIDGGGGAGLLAGMLIRGNSFTTSTLHKPLHRAVADKGAAETA